MDQGSTNGDLAILSIADLGRAFSRRSLGPVEVAQHLIRRIRDLDGTLGAYLTVTEASALVEARRAEDRYRAGAPLSALDGVPIGLKDNYDTAGVRTTACSRLYADRVPETDAVAVRKLRQAGAVIIGKHSMYEFALGRIEPGGTFPSAKNPWDLERIPGGSSSGSVAAVSAGLCFGALGSDTAGSIRWPSAFCGVVGLKPTYGLVSCDGLVPLSPTLDHAGPIARTVEDAALLLDCVAGWDRAYPPKLRRRVAMARGLLLRRLDGVRIGAPVEYVAETGDLDLDVASAYDAALKTFERLGAVVRAIRFPLKAREERETLSMVIYVKEAFDAHAGTFRTSPELFGAEFRERLDRGSRITRVEYEAALRDRETIRNELLAVDQDLVVTPTTLRPAWRFIEDAGMSRRQRIYFAHPFSLSGQPSISVPCGFSRHGLPIGLQVAGRPFDDAAVLAAAHAYEQETRWKCQPPIAV